MRRDFDPETLIFLERTTRALAETESRVTLAAQRSVEARAMLEELSRIAAAPLGGPGRDA